MPFTELGPGTLEINSGDYSCEVLGASIGHEYAEVGEQRTMLCGEKRQAKRERTDSLTVSLENDLTSTGLYPYLVGLGDDPDAVTFTYTPNTADGASWSGSIFPLLPSSIGADEYSAPISSEITFPGDGAFTFTAAA